MPNAFEDFLTAPAPAENAFAEFVPKRNAFAEFVPKRNAFADFTETAAEPPAETGPGWTSDKIRRLGEGATRAVTSLPEALGNTAAGIIEGFADLPPRIQPAPHTFKTRHAFRAQQSIPDEEWPGMLRQRDLERQAATPQIVDDLRAASQSFAEAKKTEIPKFFGANPKYDQTLGAQIASGVGSSVPSIVAALYSGGGSVAATATAAPSYAMTGLQLYQDEFDEAVGRGWTPDRAHAAGLAAMPLAGFEKFGDVRLGKALRKNLDEAFASTARKPVGKLAAEQGLNIAGNIAGEGATELAQDVGQQFILDPQGNIDWERALRAGLVGAATGGIVSAPGSALTLAANARKPVGQGSAAPSKVLPVPAAPKVFSEFGGEAEIQSSKFEVQSSTFPESPATPTAQLDRFRTGHRPAVLFTPNDADPIPAEGEVLTPTEHGRILHRPEVLPVQAVTTAARENRLGDVLGYGVPAKPSQISDLKSQIVITQRDAQGTPINDVVATPETAPNITSALQQQARPGDTLEQRAPEAVIAERATGKDSLQVERAAAFGQALDQRDQQQHDWSEFAKPAEGAAAETVEQRAAAVRENMRVMEELRAEKEKISREAAKAAKPEPRPPSPPSPLRGTPQPPPEAVTTSGRALGERPWDIIDDLEANVGKLSLGSALKHAEDFKPAGLLKKLFAKSGGYGLDDALNNLHQMGLARRIETEGELLDALHDAAGARENWQEEAARMEAGGWEMREEAGQTARRGISLREGEQSIPQLRAEDFSNFSREVPGRQQPGDTGGRVDVNPGKQPRPSEPVAVPAGELPPANPALQERIAALEREARQLSLTAAQQPGSYTGSHATAQARYIEGQVDLLRSIQRSGPPAVEKMVQRLHELAAERKPLLQQYQQFPDYPSGRGALAQSRYIDGQTDLLHELIRKEQSSGLESKLDALKIDTRGQLHAFGLVPEVWNTFIDGLKLGIRAGRAAGELIREGLAKLKEQFPDFDLEGARAALEKQFTPNIASDPPEGHGLRAFVGKTERASTLSPEVLAGLTDRFYKIESDEERAQVAQAVIDRYGVDEALALYQDTDARVMPASFRSTLGAALVDHAAQQERTARALGDTEGSTRWVEFQRTILAQHAQESTATGQALESMKAWYRLTPAAKLAEARATFEKAAQRVWKKAKPDVDAFMGRLQEARRVAWQQLFADPAVNRSARAAVDEAIVASPETHRGIVMEVTEEWAQSPYIVGEARRQMRELVNGKMRLAGQTTGGLKELKARFGLMMDDVVNRAVTIANGHYQGSDALPSGAPMRTLAQKFQERLGLNKAASEKMAVAFDKEFARLVDVKRKGIQKRLATQRARQAEGLAGGETNPVDRALRAQLRAHNLKLGQIAKMHADAKAQAGQSIIDSIIQSSGLTGEKADALRATLERRFAELLKAAAAKEIAKLTPRQKKTLEKKGAGNALLEAARLGALDTQQSYELVQQRLGLPAFTAEIQQRLLRMFNDIEAVPKDQLAKRHRMESDALEFIAQQKGIEFWNDIVPGLFFNNALSGPITHLRNFGFTGLLGIMDNMVTLVHHAARGDFTAADTMLRAARDGAGRGLLSAREEIITGKVHKTGEKVQQSTAFNAFKFKGPLAKPLNALLWLQRAPGRFLRAEDLFWFKSNEEIAQSLALRRVARSEGLRGGALKQRVANDRGRVDERVAAAEAQAVREGYGSETVKRKLEFRQRVWEIITARREQLAPGSGESAVQYALRNTLTNEPYGALGYALQAYDGLIAGLRRNDSRVANALGTGLDIAVPFRRIAVNALNETLNWTPVGNVRAWREGSITGALKPEGMDAEALGHLHTKAIVGSALISALATLASQGLISLFGLGPDDREKRKLWQQAGGVPYSIKVGNTSLKYQSSPLGYPLAILGAYHDAIRYRGLDEKDADVRAAFVMNAAMRSWLDQSFLSSTKDLLDGLSSASVDSAPEHITRSLARPVATTAVPGKAFFDFVDRVFDPLKYDAHDMKALLAQQIPFVRRHGRPELDALGQPVRVLVTDKDFRSVEPDPLYVAFDRANVWPSTPSRETIVGDKSRGPDYYRVLTPEEHYDYVRESGGDIRDRRDRLDPDRILSLEPAQAKAYVQKVVREARERALRRVPR